VTRWVLGRVLPLAIFELGRLHNDARAVRPSALVVRGGVDHTNHHRVRDLALPRWPTLIAHVANDDRSLAEAELRSVVLANPHALDKPERRAKPIDRSAHV
jgi:hypothetical protein